VVELTLLAVNAGSSSLKTALFDDDLQRLATLSVPRLDLGELHTRLDGRDEVRPLRPEHREAHPLAAILDEIDRRGLPEPSAVGHRFVHGGPDLHTAARLDERVLGLLHGLVPWAPLHQPAALDGVEIVSRTLPDAPQVGCFDTAFHWTMPEEARRLPLPDWTWKAGIRRYGFHGLSCEHVLASLSGSPGRVIIAHLGNGTSLTAVADGRSVDTSMGFTPDGGVVMGSRTGDLDPGVLLHLLDDGLSAADLRAVVEEHGGLRGLSGGTADMRTLLDRRRQGEPAATLAVTTYVRRIRMQIGAYVALLGGLDVLAVTGGIGEHAVEVRDEVLAGLDCLGSFDVQVVAADEELVIARHTRSVLAGVG
jgi:acetate kinase